MTTDALTRREAAEIDALVEGRTILDVFNHNADHYPDRPAIHWRRGGDWHDLTWSRYRTLARQAAAGLSALGVVRGDFVAIQAGNRPEHVIADLGAIHLGAAGVTIYSTMAPNQVAYIARDCGASVAIIEDLSFMKRWEEIRPDLEGLTHVVLMEGAENYATVDWVLSWDELLERGRVALESDPGQIDTSGIGPEDLATLIYTSGTTGNPKGVRVTHRNVMWTSESSRRAAILADHPRGVSYLPLAHIAERITSHYQGIYRASEVWFCPDMSQVLEYVQQSRPTFFVGVPRVWEKVATGLQARFAQVEGIQAKLLAKARELGMRKVEAEEAGRAMSPPASILHRLLDRVVLAKVRRQLGMEQVELAVTAAAPITPDLIRFFVALGIPLYEVYGMSENTGPATSNRPGASRIGSIGIPLPGVEVKLADDDELWIRGGIVTAGYHHLPDETAETFDAEGWLHTGDLARQDPDGFLFLVGRKKEIIITAAGKNVAPARLETILTVHPLVSKACMVGDGRRYITMVISLDPEVAPGWASAHGLEYVDLASFSRLPRVVAAVQQAVDEANQQVSRVEQVKRFFIAPDEWTPESGEVTASLKLKRRVILDHYADEIEALYAG
ncbi:MAG: AMP-dependent synthetase/ligase [Acidimicrobiia bacterium]